MHEGPQFWNHSLQLLKRLIESFVWMEAVNEPAVRSLGHGIMSPVFIEAKEEMVPIYGKHR